MKQFLAAKPSLTVEEMCFSAQCCQLSACCLMLSLQAVGICTALHDLFCGDWGISNHFFFLELPCLLAATSGLQQKLFQRSACAEEFDINVCAAIVGSMSLQLCFKGSICHLWPFCVLLLLVALDQARESLWLLFFFGIACNFLMFPMEVKHQPTCFLQSRQECKLFSSLSNPISVLPLKYKSSNYESQETQKANRAIQLSFFVIKPSLNASQC